MTEVSADWYDGFCESEWLDYLSLGTTTGWTERTVDFLIEQLDLRPGARVLDLACGRGRVAIPLARRSLHVVGLDLSARSLELARREAAEAHVPLELLQRDMRQLDAVEEFDAVINLYSSFGYFDVQEADERVLTAVGRALVPGGRFFIDTINPIALARIFRTTDWREFDDGTLMLERQEYNHLRGRTEATWTFLRPDGNGSELRHSMRAYTAAELVTLFAQAGLHIDGSWGSWEGAPSATATAPSYAPAKPPRARIRGH